MSMFPPQTCTAEDNPIVHASKLVFGSVSCGPVLQSIASTEAGGHHSQRRWEISTTVVRAENRKERGREFSDFAATGRIAVLNVWNMVRYFFHSNINMVEISTKE